MKNLTKIETCSNCYTQYRIPIDKHIIANCPKCGYKFEYKNGKKVRSKKTWITIFFILSILGLVWLIYYNRKVPIGETTITTDTTSYTSNISISNTFDQNIKKDTLDLTKKILDTLEDKILDKSPDILKDLLDQTIDRIKEDIENGRWEQANESFERATDIMKNGGKNGKSLFKRYEDKLAKLKIAILSKNPSIDVLSPSEVFGNTKKENSNATEYVTNNTEYTLTLYYTGLTNKIITIPAGKTEVIILQKGSYSIIAKVSTPLVKETYRSQVYRGFSYRISYIISIL